MEQPAPRNLSHQLLTPSNLNKHAQRRGTLTRQALPAPSVLKKHVRRWGTPTRQALPAPSVLKKNLKGWIPGDRQPPTSFTHPINFEKTCPKMGCSHQTSFFRPIGFEKTSERMGPGSSNHPHKLTRPGSSNHPHKLTRPGPITTPTKTSTKKPAPPGPALHNMAARPVNSYLFISSIMASAP